jgi:hypothetical protein
MKNIPFILLFLVLGFGFGLKAQNIEDMLDNQIKEGPKTELVPYTFKSVLLINSHTTKLPDKGEWVLLISHRFGFFSNGFSTLWGLDQATIRLGAEFGVTPTTSLGFGRSTYKSNYDLYAKQLLLRQSTGAKNMPLTLALLGVANISSQKWPDDGRTYLFAHRISYTLQLMASRKFNRSISMQLMPTFIHRNLVATPSDQNDVLAIGVGGRVKISNRVALTGEYHYLLPGNTADYFVSPLSFGVDIETGGHVFQLFVTNASAIYDAAFIPETTTRWSKGEIRFGFNISRTF